MTTFNKVQSYSKIDQGEFRTVDDDLTDIENSISNLQVNDTILSGNINSNSNDINTLQNDLITTQGTLNSQVSTLSGRLDGHDTDIFQLQTDVSTNQTNITNNTNNLSSLSNDLTNFQIAQSGTNNGLQNQIDTLDSNLSTLETNFNNFTTSQGINNTSYQSQIDSNDIDITNINNSLSSFQTSQNATNSSLQNQITNNDNDITNIQTQINNGDFNQIVLQNDGSQAVPAIRFSSDTDLGLYRDTINSLAFVTNNSILFRMTDVSLVCHRSLGPNGPGFDLGGTGSGRWSNVYGVNTITDTISLAIGSQANPSLNFQGDNNTGLYRPAADQLAIVTNGNLNTIYKDTDISVYKNLIPNATGTINLGSVTLKYNTIHSTISQPDRLRTGPGSGALPSISFSSKNDTGVYLFATSPTRVRNSIDGLDMQQYDPTSLYSRSDILPWSDTNFRVGNPSFRYDSFHAINGTIQTSDSRLKNSIQPLDLGLEFIIDLNPVSYKWNDTISLDPDGNQSIISHTRTHLGLIAQEVESVINIHGKTLQDVDLIDNDNHLDPEALDRYSMRTTNFIPILIKAIQDLSNKFDVLETRVSNLEANP